MKWNRNRDTRRMASSMPIALLGLVIAACSSHPNQGRYSQSYDSAPPRLPTEEELRDAEPTGEAPSRQGNRTYELFGRRYQILDDVSEFQAEGMASWYGTKFHGHLTSNGETYDMYEMSAAHKTLPLPTYLKVTNLANQKSVIVRVNDRGPFHGDRIIDLSYAAAYKVGMLDTGTARVRLEAIKTPLMMATPNSEVAHQQAPTVDETTVDEKPPISIPSHTSEEEPFYFIQVMAAQDEPRLAQEADALSQLFQVPATTQENNGLHRLVLGPLADSEATALLKRLKAQGYSDVFRVKVQ